LGYITGLGHDEEHAKVEVFSKGEYVVPRHHIRVNRPKGRGNKVVIVQGDDIGKVGLLESTSVKYKGNYLVREHISNKALLVNKDHLALLHKF
jgi:hypothetical protein